MINLTPFSVKSILGIDSRGAETLAVVIKGTFRAVKGSLQICEEQEPVHLADEYWDDPEVSSLRHCADSALFKPKTDILLSGHAYAPGGTALMADVTLNVASVNKSILIFGNRFWEKGFFGTKASGPEAFERIPLVYERAFGGIDSSVGQAELRNPAGVGFRGKRSKVELIGMPLPNIENPYELIGGPGHKPSPVGFGPIGPHWKPRVNYAGTYDQNWVENVAPMLPDDYDPLFQQCAPPDQIVPYLKGGEPVEVLNASPGGYLCCTVPALKMQVVIGIDEERRQVPVNLDTLIIDGDGERIICVFRGCTSVHGLVYDVEWIKVAIEKMGAVL
ncbi:MAG TPA: DUF2169 domain-containing protein [Chitinispirillaceae bacterium]|nr:DUF2169 domain-containing protein [Chitinispirillaceae bacterium]